MRLQSLATWMTPLAAGADRKTGPARATRLLIPFIIIAATLVGMLAVAVFSYINPGLEAELIWAQLALAGFGVALTVGVALAVRLELYDPLSFLRTWMARVRSDDLSARVRVPRHGEFRGLAQDMNHLADALESLTTDMEAQVSKQTERIEQKTRSLQVLYDVAASLNVSRDLNDLLIRFLHTMRDIVDAKAGTVRMLTENDQMELVASIGLDDEVVEKERIVPVQRCLCGNAVAEGEVLFQNNLRNCDQFVGRPMLDGEDEMEMIAVPLQYRGENLGVYNLFVRKEGSEQREDVKALFTSIGRHLGMAIEKSRLDNEAKRLFIMQERTALAHELHDSLAQTLASLRFQVTMLSETLEHESKDEAKNDIQQIKGGLDDAYTELRELLAHFRAPVNTRGLLPALEDLISSFRKQTGMYVLLQKDEWDSSRLPVDLEMQVLRIVQEALANVRKHSQAQTVRVMLRSDVDGNYHVLVEDDGVGLQKPAFSGHPGEHIGQSIMQERARRVSGDLSIDSEPGEGTCLTLTFRYPKDDNKKEQRHRTIPLVPK